MPAARWCSALAIFIVATCTASLADITTPVINRTLREVSDDLENPAKLIPDPAHSDTILVAERAGRVLAFNTRSGRIREVIDIEAIVGTASPRGLMSIAAQASGSALTIVVGYMDPQGDLVVGRFSVPDSDKSLDDSSMTVVIKIARLSPHRLGSSLEFGTDGALYIATSDGEMTNDGPTTPSMHAAELPQSLLGKAIRIRPGERTGYSVPTDNPFVKQSSFQPEIYALGFHAPEALFSAPLGNQMVLLDSNDRNNEINLVERGKNYGWDEFDGRECRRKDRLAECAASPSVRPILALPKVNSNSALVGGLLYQGERYPELRGSILFADRTSGTVYAADEKSPGIWEHRVITQTPQGSIAAIGNGTDGAIYIATDAGKLFALQ